MGTDADGDGVRDPHDIDDAALSAGVYSVRGDRDLSHDAGLRAAVYSYNHSDDYVALVISLAHRYATGTDVVPNTSGYAPDVHCQSHRRGIEPDAETNFASAHRT